MLTPVAASTNSCPCSYDPARQNISASRCNCQEYPSGGKFSTASRGNSDNTPLTSGPVADPPHPHLTQQRHHRPAMTGLGTSPLHPVLTGHPRQPDLTLSLGVQGQLDQTAQQLPALPG